MKWLGALLVGASSYILGIFLAKREGMELDTLESMTGFLSYMRRRMEGELIPLYEVFSRYENGCLENLGFLPLLRSCRNGLNIAWNQAVFLLPVSENLRKELEIFGESLGRIPLENQIRCLDICVNALEDEKKKVQSQLPQKQKSIKTVCLLVGALMAIILL